MKQGIKAIALCTPEARVLRDEWYLKTLQDDWDLRIIDCELAGNGGGDFGSASWRNLNLTKIQTLIRCIKEYWGELVIWSDLDIQFFRPCTPIIKESMAGRDIVFQSESWPHQGVNCGFFALHCNEKTLKLWEIVQAENIESLPLGDQTVINALLKAGTVDLSWGAFPHQIWARSHSGMPPDDIAMHHANCTVVANSIEAKIAQLAQIRSIVNSRKKKSPPDLQEIVRLQLAGQVKEAIELCQRTLAAQPVNAAILHALGQIECGRKRFREAVQAMQRLLQLDPENAEYLTTFGALLYEMGNPKQSIELLEKAERLDPSIPQLHYHLGNTYEKLTNYPPAEKAYRRAVELKPDYTEAHARLGHLLNLQARFAQAMRHCQTAVRYKPKFVYALGELGLALSEQGRLRELLTCRRRVVEATPKSVVARSNYLATLFYDADTSPIEYLKQCRQWDDAYRYTPESPPFSNTRDPDRALRVGYVSSHFTFHIVGRLLLPLLRQHNRSQFSIYCYSAAEKHDANTKRLKQNAAHWREIPKMPAEKICELIQQDKIDILVDTIGHFGGSLLTVFARKPAPILVTHFGHFSTTGLAAMDYRLTDSLTDPASGDFAADGHNSEKLVRMDPCAYCYLPEEPVPEPAPPPCLANADVTFGCLNNLIKMTDPCVALWSRVLLAVPRSRLLLLAHGDEQSKQYTRDRFIRHGIDAGRLQLVDKCSHAEYLRQFGQIDIALDPFPYNGDNTTCDGLWCGVPLITLAGTWSIARRGISHLSAIGLQDWIAPTPEEYVARAAKFAADPQGLAQLRSTLRKRMIDSPLCDAAGFARKMENAYRLMWTDWCKSFAANASARP